MKTQAEFQLESPLLKNMNSNVSKQEKRYQRNNDSLRLRLDAGAKLLEEQDPDCYILFCLLGCLPDGIKRDQLIEFWGHEIEVEMHVEVLKGLMFLESSEDKI